MASKVSSVVLRTPPTIGAAMRRSSSDPAPAPSIIGNKPAKTVSAVMSLGRKRSSAPSLIASSKSSTVCGAPSWRRPGPGLVQIQQHHHAGLRRKSSECNEADGRGYAHVITQRPEQPGPTNQRKRKRPQDQQHVNDAATSEIQHDENDHNGQRNNELEAPHCLLEVFVLSCPPD